MPPAKVSLSAVPLPEITWPMPWVKLPVQEPSFALIVTWNATVDAAGQARRQLRREVRGERIRRAVAHAMSG